MAQITISTIGPFLSYVFLFFLILLFHFLAEDVKATLDVFLNSSTSEDNESFQEVMRAAELKHRHKVCWK
jgi:hypothetical protein